MSYPKMTEFGLFARIVKIVSARRLKPNIQIIT